MNPGSSGVKQQQQTAASIGGGSSLSLSSSCSSSSAEEEILVVEETAAGQSLPPPLFFIKPIDSQGQSIAGKERLEDRGTLLPVANPMLPAFPFSLPEGLVGTKKKPTVASATDLYLAVRC